VHINIEYVDTEVIDRSLVVVQFVGIEQGLLICEVHSATTTAEVHV